MPNRIVRDGILRSRRVAALSPAAEVFYRRLMSVADDFGRYYADIPILLSDCFPYRPSWADEESLSLWVAECESQELIFTYSVSGSRFLEIWNFGQRLKDGKVSKFPAFPAAGGLFPPNPAAGGSRASSPPPNTPPNTNTEAVGIFGETDCEKIISETEALYVTAGLPSPPGHRNLIAQYLSAKPRENWARLPAYVADRLSSGRWPSPAKTKAFVQLMRDGDWDVPILPRTAPIPVNGTRHLSRDEATRRALEEA